MGALFCAAIFINVSSAELGNVTVHPLNVLLMVQIWIIFVCFIGSSKLEIP